MVEVETTNFVFRGIGTTEATARLALKRAWTVHARQTHAALDYINAAEDGNVFVLTAGQGWRDDQVLTGRVDGR
jgi:hypothetical protein